MSMLNASGERRWSTVTRIGAALAGIWLMSGPAYAQLDPLLYLKRSQPNIIIMLDTGVDMQRDAPTDNTNPYGTSNYYDPFIYTKKGGSSANWESAIGVNATTVTTNYRRKYAGLTPASNSSTAFTASTISTVGDLATSSYQLFEAPTRLSIARAAIYRAILENQGLARFGLYTMRQNNPTMPTTQGNFSPVVDSDSNEQTDTDTGFSGKWKITMPTVSGNNGSWGGGGWLFGTNNAACSNCNADNSNATTNILSTLALDERSGGLIPAGNDSVYSSGQWMWARDRPVLGMLTDLENEAFRLILNDTFFQSQCRNTVGILITSGGEGSTTGSANPASFALQFLSAFTGRRVPIIVIALAPAASDIPQLQSIATNSGGQYIEISYAQMQTALASPIQTGSAMGLPATMAGTVVVPEVVKALNLGVQTAFQNFGDLNTSSLGWRAWFGWHGYQGSSEIQSSEFQIGSPIIGTVDLSGANDINGSTLPLTSVTDRQGNPIPQRSNLMVTTAFVLPGFDGMLRGFRVYKPQADTTQLSGYKFVSDGTPLWIASTPTTGSRNLYTAMPDGTMIAFSTANAATLAPLMNLTVADATAVITSVLNTAIGPVVDSTPAIESPPSLDPPPEDSYPAFATANANRRSIIWVGTNYGILEGIDARLGQEVFGFIPTNLLPALRTVRDGQPIGQFSYMMDGSPKVADVQLPDGSWRTYLFVGEGPGGTFYQTLDVTLANIAQTVPSNDDNIADVLAYFGTGSAVTLQWEYPLYADFEPNCANTATLGANICASAPYGDLKASSPALEKTVGQTWSDPAIGQVVSDASPYSMLAGSGFFPYSRQQLANRGGVIAGTTFYVFNAVTGQLLDSRDAGNDGVSETIDNCAAASVNNCSTSKNALQSDPVATGPSDSRFITSAYSGSLDGKLLRFDLSLNGSNVPQFSSNPTVLYTDPVKQPIFGSMATVNVGGTQQYVFVGTGSDLLPANGVSTQYRLLGFLDNGTSATKTFEIDLNKVDGQNGDEKVTTFPAVAGDIVFFTTTTTSPSNPCSSPSASLYALTFIGGPAYDTNNDGKFNSSDSVLVKTIAGQRATAPFIVDQHLAFGTGSTVQMFGNSSGYNNGVGQAGVRILSWREVR